MEVRETNSLNELRKLFFKVDTGLKPNTRKGTVLLIAFSIMVSPALAIDFNSSKALQYYGDGSTLDFEVGTNGETFMNGNLGVLNPSPDHSLVIGPDGGEYFSVKSNQVLVGDDQGNVNGGSASTPILAISDPNSGLYDSGANEISLSTDGVRGMTLDSSQNVQIPNGDLTINGQLTTGSTECPVGSYIDGDGTCTSVTGETSGEYVDEAGDTMTGPLNITDIANFTSSGIEFYQPLSVDSPGSLSVDNGVDLTGSGSNTIDSYSTLYLKTSSGSPSDIVLRPSGQVGIDSNLETTGNLTVNGQEIDATGATLKNVNLEAGSVDESEINQNTLDDSEIQDNSLSAQSLAAGSVGNSEINNGGSFTFSGITNNGNLDMSGNRIDNVGAPNSIDDAMSAQYWARRGKVQTMSHDGYISWSSGQLSWNDRLIVIPVGSSGTHFNVQDSNSPVSIGTWDVMYIRPTDSDYTSGGSVDLSPQVTAYGSYDPDPNDIILAWRNGDTSFLHLASGEVLAPGERIDGNSIDRNRVLDMGSNKITSLQNPTAAQDAATKDYVDSEVSSGTTTATQTLSEVLSEGTSAGSYSINMNNNNLNGVNALNIQDAGIDGRVDFTGNARIYNAPLDDSNTDGYLQLVNDEGIAFEAGGDGSTQAVLNSNGRLGIGTSNPQRLLDVNGDARIRGNLDIWGEIRNTQVSTLNINGSLVPPSGYSGTFDIGNSSRQWRNADFSGSIDVDGNVDNVDLDNPGNAITLSGSRYAVASNSINDNEVADNSLTASSLATGSVDTSEIASNSVTNTEIANSGTFDFNRVDVNGVSGSASTDGSVGIGAPTVYTNMVEAQTEKGGSSTYIELGSGGYHGSVGADDIAFVTQGEVQAKVDSNGDLDLNSNSLIGVGGTQCADNEFIDGSGQCETVSSAGGSDDQTLAEVLSQGNSANQDINMNGYNLDNIDQVEGQDYIDLRPNDGTHGVIMRQYGGGGSSWSGIRTLSDGTMQLRTDGSNYDQLELYDSGEVEIGSGSLDMAGNAIINADWSDANDLNSAGTISDFSAAADLNSAGTISDFSAGNDLDSSGGVVACDADSDCDVQQIQFTNTEDVNDGELGRDNSIGFLGSWGGQGTAVLWDAYNVIDGNAITVSGGKGAESNPTIAVTSNSIDDAEIVDNGISAGSIASGAVGSSELSSNAVTASGGELDSSVAGNQISYNSGSLDVSEGSGSGLDADTLDGSHKDDFAESRWTYKISSAGGTEYQKIGEFRQRDAEFKIEVIAAEDQGGTQKRRVSIIGSKWSDQVNAEHVVYGDNGENIDIVLTETSNDANGDTYNDAYVYAVADDYSQAKVIIEMENDNSFTEDLQTGLSSGDLVGTTVFDSNNAPSGQVFAGSLGLGSNSAASTLDVNGAADIRGNLDMNSNRINNLVDPSSAQDAATKNYVDSQASGATQTLSEVLDQGNTANQNIDMNGNSIDDVNRIGNSAQGKYFDFSETNSYIEAQDAGGGRLEVVTQDTYVNEDGFWLGDEDLVNINAGTDLSGGGTNGLTDQITINHADTSSQGNVATSGGTIIDDIDLDGRGHLTNINTRNIDGRYINVGESGDSLSDNTVDNSEIQNSDSFTFGGVTLNGELDTNGNHLNLDSGQQYITIHDGNGNFNIKSGVDPSNNIVAGSGGTHVRLDESGGFDVSVDEGTAAGNAMGESVGLGVDGNEVDIRGGSLNLNSNSIVNIGGLNGCGGNQFVDGNGNCQTDNAGTDSQDLGYSNDNAPTGNYQTHTVTITGGSNTAIRDYYDPNTNTQLDDVAATGTVDISDEHITNVKEIELQDWDSDAGGTDNSVRLLRRDNNWMFYNGGFVVGNYGDGVLGDIGDGNMRIEGTLTVDGGTECAADEALLGDGSCGSTGTAANKDLVAGSGLSGGANDVLPGSDSDVTISLNANDLDSNGNINDFSAAADLDSAGTISDFSAGNDLNSGGGVVACDGDSECNIQRLNFQNEEQPANSDGRVYFDENYYSDFGQMSGDGGGLAVYSQDGWGAVYSTANDEHISPTFASDSIGGGEVDESSLNCGTITGGGGLCDGTDNTGSDSQNLGYNNLNAPTGSYVNHEITISGGSNTNIRDYYEADTTIADDQTLSTTADVSGTDDRITISGGNSITVDDDYDANTDASTKCGADQVLEGGDNCVTNYEAGDDGDSSSGNEIQDLGYSNDNAPTGNYATHTITMSDGGSNTAIRDYYDPNTDSQGLGSVLNNNNAANQPIDMNGNNITDNSQGNITFGKSIKVHGAVYASDAGQGEGPTISDILSNGNDMNGNTITDSDGNVTVGSDLQVQGGKVWVDNADLAEYYESSQQLEDGELVKISGSEDDSVRRTGKAYGPVEGIVSTDPGYVLNSNSTGYPIALTGKVPVKVSEENGEIERGDRIVPSSKPGVAMTCEIKPLDDTEGFKEYKKVSEDNRKCRDSTIGKALENSDGKSKILVKVSG